MPFTLRQRFDGLSLRLGLKLSFYQILRGLLSAPNSFRLTPFNRSDCCQFTYGRGQYFPIVFVGLECWIVKTDGGFLFDGSARNDVYCTFIWPVFNKAQLKLKPFI